jgi:glycosyltransferase involved in cell wall biosynthesis
MNELVSIVMPTYNHAHFIGRALCSVLDQTYNNWEVIVVDNHSTDNTDEVVCSFNSSRIKLIKIHNNGIIAVSRNAGVKEAKGSVIAFLDSDDWWAPQKLELSVNKLDLGFDVVYHDLWLVDITGKKRLSKRVGARQLNSPVYEDLIKNGNALPNSSVLVRKGLLIKINGLSEEKDLIAAEDFDCWLRLSNITEKFGFLPQPLGYYLHSGTNNSNAHRKSKNLKRLFELHFIPFIREHRIEMPTWIMYISARTAYQVGEKEEAKKMLRILLTRILPFNLWLKIQWMLLRLKIAG